MSEAEAHQDRPLFGDLDFAYLIEKGAITVAGWCVLLAVLTFSVYWFLGPKDTSYSYQVQQANNILHGHLDLVPEYTPTINAIERVLYDGEGFCLPRDDPRGHDQIENPRLSDDCRTYMQHSLGPALMVIPGVLLFGVDLNQALVSAVMGALTAPLVFLIARQMSSRLVNQLLLTVMMMFGTILWWSAPNGGVWMFAHTTAVFFTFAAIYFAVGRSNPLLAGAALGAAFLCRPTMILAGLFFVIFFMPLWLRPPAPGRRIWQRIDLEPAAAFVAGITPFVFTAFLLNYLRFDDPLETGYGYTEQVHQTYLQAYPYNHGLFDLSYVTRHPAVMLEQTPIFSKEEPYIRPSWFGMAMWITTPALLLAYFPNIKVDRRIWIPAAIVLAISCGVILSRGFVRIWDLGWATTDIPFGIHLLPFWALIGVAIAYAWVQRDRLVLACWAAIIPMAFLLFTFAATGWSQFGYRYGLDFMPFLWLLVARAIGDNLKWWHWVLVLIGVAINAMGVFWIYHFDVHDTFGWTWASF